MYMFVTLVILFRNMVQKGTYFYHGYYGM